MNELNNQLRQQAIKLGLCQQWQDEWSADKTPEELIEMYKRGIDFAIEHHYPDNSFIKSHFDEATLNEHQVYVDSAVNLPNAQSGIYVLNGHCTGSLHFGSWAAATVYVRDTSDIHISATDHAKVFVRVYDNAKVLTGQDETSVLRIYDRKNK